MNQTAANLAAWSTPAEAGLPLAWTKLRIHPMQRRAFASRKRFLALACGRRSGKTEIALRRLIAAQPEPKPWPDPRYFFAADTLPHARDIAWDRLLALMPPDWIVSQRHSLDCMEIRTRFGTMVRIVGLNKPSAIEGRGWDGCVIDESCDVHPSAWRVSVYPALTDRRGWAWRIGVPKRTGRGAHDFRSWCDSLARGDDPDGEFLTWPSADILPPDMIAHAKRTMDAKDYREQFEAQWETAGGGIYHAFDLNYNVRSCAYSPDERVVVGMDFNRDPMAWVFGHVRDDQLHVFEELFTADTYTAKQCDAVADRFRGHRAGGWIMMDASAGQRKTGAQLSDYATVHNHAGLRAAGFEVKYPFVRPQTGKLCANPAQADRFAAVNARLQSADGQRHIYVDPSCRHLIDDLLHYGYQAGSSIPQQTHELSHATDALGYLVWYLWPMRLRNPVAAGRSRVILTAT